MNPKLKEDVKKYLQDPKNKILIGVLLVFMLILICLSLLPESKKSDALVDEITADTVIPAGYVLVPIEIENAGSMSSMMGAYGIVDLFATNAKSQRGHKVGSRLKILRAPLNPDQYAVLVRESEASALLEASGPFFAVIQNPEIQKSEAIYKKKIQKKSRVEYFSEGGL